jgi:hypothetical protein
VEVVDLCLFLPSPAVEQYMLGYSVTSRFQCVESVVDPPKATAFICAKNIWGFREDRI